MKELEMMTVKELRQESRERKLTLESKGHKFTKQELIERIRKYDAEQKDINDDILKTIEEAGKEEVETKQEVQEKKEEVQETKNNRAETLEEIEKKYGNRKHEWIYDKKLVVGSFVVFVHYVEAANHEIYKKLRTAKVVGVNRKKELVRVETILGTEKELTFDDLLYIKGVSDRAYPLDIKSYMMKQRTEKGTRLVYERMEKQNKLD